MAHNTTSKKSNKDDSGSDSEEEINNGPSFLIAENARLNDLLDNRDDVLIKTNKEKREYMSLLGEAKEKVVELESLLVDARAQIDSLKSAPVVTNEPKCTDCSTFLGELTVLMTGARWTLRRNINLGNKCCTRSQPGVVLGQGYKCKPLVLVIGIEQLHNKTGPVPTFESFRRVVEFFERSHRSVDLRI
jgi:hypothetical protein